MTVKVAHVRLCPSRMLLVRSYPRETQEMVLTPTIGLSCCSGAAAGCGRGIYDNMKTAVETVFVGKDRLYNRRFLQMCRAIIWSSQWPSRRRCVSGSSRRGCGSRTSMN